MRGDEDVLMEQRLGELAGRLRGPARHRADLLREARHALLDAVEAYRGMGLSPVEAERRAVAEFGSPAQLIPGYQAELAAGALRGLALRALALAGALTWPPMIIGAVLVGAGWFALARAACRWLSTAR